MKKGSQKPNDSSISKSAFKSTFEPALKALPIGKPSTDNPEEDKEPKATPAPTEIPNNADNQPTPIIGEAAPAPLPEPTVSSQIERAEAIQELSEKHERSIKYLQSVKAFNYGSDGSTTSVTLQDSTGRRFTSNRPEVIKMVIELTMKSLETEIYDLEKQIVKL